MNSLAFKDSFTPAICQRKTMSKKRKAVRFLNYIPGDEELVASQIKLI